MTTPDIALRLLDGRQAAQRAAELLAVHDEVYAELPYRWGPDQEDRYAGRLPVLCRQPGFLLAEARHGDYLVGYALGLPLRPSTDWWRDLTSRLPAEVTTEYQGRSFALTGLLVRAPWRRQRIGESLHDLIMAGHPAERGLAAVLTTAGPAQCAFGRWGWRKIARKQESCPGSPVFDVFVRTLDDHDYPDPRLARAGLMVSDVMAKFAADRDPWMLESGYFGEPDPSHDSEPGFDPIDERVTRCPVKRA